MAENKSNLFNEIKNKTGKVDYDGDYGIVNPLKTVFLTVF